MDLFLDILQFTLVLFLWALIWVGPLVFLVWLGYFFISASLRRQQRVRLFLDILETGVNSGRPAEEMILSLARKRDLTLGISFHVVAAYLQKGLPLAEALRHAPDLVPRQISQMLAAGLKLGDISKVFPACRQISRDAVSQTSGSMNYLVLIAFIGFPANLLVFACISHYVLPIMYAVFQDMNGGPLLGVRLVMASKNLFYVIEISLVLIIWTAVFLYSGGARLFSAWHQEFAPLTDRLLCQLPWRRIRLQRDFATMLAILLDAEVPEPEAVRLAADCTDNLVFRRNAQRAVVALGEGMTLPEAVHYIDDASQFRWRLATALRAHSNLLRGITGWRESLDAKAFQQEQAFSQIITTALVILNGLVVGVVVIGLFSGLISLINSAVLW